MIYPLDFETRVGFDRIRAEILSRCNTSLSREMAENITFSTDVEQIKVMLQQSQQMVACLQLEENFPQNGYVDVEPFLRKIMVDGMFLEQLQLQTLSRALTLSEQITSFFTTKEEYNALRSLCEGVGSFAIEIKEIDKIIDDQANVRDSASRELADIRLRLTHKEREVGRRLQSILLQAQSEGIVSEDVSLSIRDGRSVIPIPTAMKRKIKGLIYDESATGKTSYIEPMEVVELNNQIKELKSEEKREVRKILIAFTATLRPRYSELDSISKFISTIDFIRSKAVTSIKQGGEMPQISAKPMLDMVQGRHPILESHLKGDNKAIVPLDVWLTEQKHILLISGPNAGGKSVCLKTVGLLQYMVQCGLLIPAKDNSTFGIFSSIFIDIGDQQSLDNDLSTYSSHLQNMKQIVRNGDKNTLVLIDEFGTGTEPSLGGAIAESILERMEQERMFGVITTHYTNLKYYADKSSGVANGAMSFDVQRISPLFRLEIGKPGSSFAFEIAHKIGLPDDIISSAKSKIGVEQLNLEKQLREIARDKRYWENKRDKIRVAERKAEELAATYQEEVAKLKEQRNTLIKDAKERATTIVSGANKVIENTIREIKEAQAEKERTKEARTKVEKFKEQILSDKDSSELEISRKMELLRQKQQRRGDKRAEKELQGGKTEPKEDKNSTKELKVGDNVRVKGQAVIGEISAINGKKGTIHFGSIATTVAIDKLEYVSRNEVKREAQNSASSNIFKSNYDTSQKRANFSSQIDIRGVRVEEAMMRTRLFVDEAYMLGIGEIKILHGKGTGALKQEIRRLLSTMAEVVSAEDENEQFGGAGITVVTIRES